MKITPWVQLCLANGGGGSPRTSEPLFRDSTGEALTFSQVGGWLGRGIYAIYANSIGIELDLKRTYGGIREEGYAWDELNLWRFEKSMLGLDGYTISNSKFILSALSEESCMHLYTFFTAMSCMAYVHTTGGFPSMSTGVHLGFIDPKQREFYDPNGYPNEKMRLSILEGGI